MPTLNPVVGNPTTAGDIVTDALLEIGAYQSGEEIPAEDFALGLRKMNRLFDQWNARQMYVFAVQFLSFTLIPNHGPHTIGPQAPVDFSLPQRPVKILGANLQLQSSIVVNVPIAIRDSAWWLANKVQGLLSNIPTDLYYEPAFPNGNLNFWPVPNVANQVQLNIWTALQQVTDRTTQFSLPPGYQDAVTYSLAESLVPSFNVPMNPMLSKLAMDARKAIFSNNDKSPRISLRDTGMPDHDERPSFNWMTGDFDARG